MLNQTFNPKSLNELISSDDALKFKLGNDSDEIMNSITSISYTVSQSEFSFSKVKTKIINGKCVYSVNDKNEYFAIKKLNSVIKKLYKVKHSSRNEILSQLIEIFNDGSSYKIIRADIKDFFGSIPRVKLINKIRTDSLLGSLMINKVNQLEEILKENMCIGLPRGMSISSTLSEIYLRDFDFALKSNPAVYFYARYVDDIIIVCLDDLEGIEGWLHKELKNLELSVNSKYKVINQRGKGSNFDYLGVNFDFSNRVMRYSLSDNKVKEMKSRIIKTLLDYKNNRDNELLINRFIFLTGNYCLYTKVESNNLKAGIYYNNQHINHYDQLNDINEFLRKSITAKKGSLSKVTKLIPKPVVSKCMKQCFFGGYMDKKMTNLNGSDLTKIVGCWKNGH